jgi:23S rRNA pseudouridine955/2504/2580 synthase
LSDPGSKRTAVRAEAIAAEHAGRRIDNYLIGRLGHAPKSLVYKLLRSGQVRVNGSRVKPDYRLAAADVVRIPPLVEEAAGEVTIPAARIAGFEALVLHECADFLVIDKPAGLACHAGSGLRYGVIEIARAARPRAPRLDLAHRIDRDTSGCLVLSRNVAALREFHAQQRAQRIDKRYQALLRGRVPPGLERIDAALTPTRAHGEKRSAVARGGREAATLVERRSAQGAHTLVELRLVTGRLHQIRAHALHIGHPVAGDRLYGDPAFNAELAAVGLTRLFLHASSIAFQAGGRMLEVSAPLPAALADVLARLPRRP